MGDVRAASVEPVEAGRLHDLRRRVLRGGDPSAHVDEPRDVDAATLHVGAVVEGEVVACASFYLSPYGEDGEARQLRFMAVDPQWQGRGLGARVLADGERRLRENGTRTLWANARDSALGFYRAQGWTALAGTGFLSAETRLPHTVIVKRLG